MTHETQGMGFVGRWLLLTVAALCAVVAIRSAQVLAAPQSRKPLSDSQIASAVEGEFFQDAAVPHDDIDVTSQEGVVTLSGRVTNLLARDQAQRVAQAVRGVRAVVNTLKVEPYATRSDEELQKDVVEALAYDPATDAAKIDVKVARGTATLEGAVDSYAERILAERTAKGITGVRAVQNQLTVQYSTHRPDAEIKADVEERLRWDAYVGQSLIRTGVRDGTVTLSGTVGSDTERTRAFMDAWVMGTRSVDTSGLHIEPWAHSPSDRAGRTVRNLSDADISAAVRAAWLYDPRVSSYALTPETDERVVTLHGVVDHVGAQRAAVQDARATTGVARVVNRIRVRAPASKDDDIATRIRRAFGRDPYVERYEILVSVHDGTAYLNGTVDSYYEKLRADQLASRARGVTKVRNNLTVYDDRSPLIYEPRVYDFYPHDYLWYTLRPAATRSDVEIKGDIEDELFWSPFVDQDEVKVRVASGVATLKGQVDSYSEMHSAIANAYEAGAFKVNNRLSVGK